MLLVSIAALAVNFLIMGFATTLAVLFLGRILAGTAAATVSTANAYIADVTTPETRGRAFGMIGGAFGVGFILGPALGGLLGEYFGPRAPFFAAAALSGVNFLYGLFVLPESLAPENRRPFRLARANPFGAFRHFARLPQVGWFLVVIGVFGFASNVYPVTWNFHGAIRYGWSEGQIGASLALVGIGAAVVQAGLAGTVIRRLGAMRTAALGLSVNAVAMAGFAFAGAPWMAYAIIPVSSLGGVASPALNTIMSNVTPANAQGELQGASASLLSLAMIFSPLVMSQALHAYSRDDAPVHFPGAAFLLASGLTCLCAVPFLLGIRANRAALLAAQAEPSPT